MRALINRVREPVAAAVLALCATSAVAGSRELTIEGIVVSAREIPGRGELVVLVGGEESKVLVVDVGAGRLSDAADVGEARPLWIETVDLDSDGRAEVVVGTHETIFSFAVDDGPALVPSSKLAMSSRARYPLAMSHGKLGIVSLGSVGLLGLHADQGALVLDDSIELPRRATRTSRGFRIRSPAVSHLGVEGSRFAIGPEKHGRRRLLTTLVGESEPVEVWSLLAAPETVQQSWYEVFDGRPALVAVTVQAEKVGIFSKLGLRVFPLVPGRTRAGRGASFSVETVTRRWYEVDVESLDADLDGHEDLIVVQPEGLGAGKLYVDLYSGKGNLGFVSSPRRSKLEYGEAEYLYGPDVDRDGVPDLAVLTGGDLVVHRGLAEHRKLVVEKAPRWRVAGAEADEHERAIVIEIGDSPDKEEWRRYEATRLRRVSAANAPVELLVVNSNDGRTVLQLVDFL